MSGFIGWGRRGTGLSEEGDLVIDLAWGVGCDGIRGFAEILERLGESER